MLASTCRIRQHRIGHASIARHLSADGAKIIVNYAASKRGADKVVADIEAAGTAAVAMACPYSLVKTISRDYSCAASH